MERFPVRACDFIAAPDRARLPFMDIHQTGTREDRRLAAFVPADPAAWGELDRRYRFDYALVNRYLIEGGRSLDALDADTSFALVFMDDNAALFVRREGTLAAVADSFAYRVIPAGPAGLGALGMALAADSTGRAAVAAELERSIHSSEFNASAHGYLADLAMMEGRDEAARTELRLALARNPSARYAWERLAVIALSEGRPRAALSALAHEKRRPEHREVRERLRREARGAIGRAEARARPARPRGFAGGGEAEARALIPRGRPSRPQHPRSAGGVGKAQAERHRGRAPHGARPPGKCLDLGSLPFS